MSPAAWDFCLGATSLGAVMKVLVFRYPQATHVTMTYPAAGSIAVCELLPVQNDTCACSPQAAMASGGKDLHASHDRMTYPAADSIALCMLLSVRNEICACSPHAATALGLKDLHATMTFPETSSTAMGVDCL